jgi:hypothetical protein
MKTIDEILNEWYPTIPDEEHNGLYASDKVKLIAQKFADQFRQPAVSGECEHPYHSVLGDGEIQPAMCLKCGKVL